MIKFYIDNDFEKIRPEIKYILEIWSKNQRTEINFTNIQEGAVTIGNNERNMFCVSRLLELHNSPSFNEMCLIENRNGHPDFVSTAFFMINSLQEHNDKDRDVLGRFKFTNSYQYRFKNSKENIVQHCLNEISKIIGITPRNEKTRFFLSHDIDSVNGAILEDGFNVLKKGRIDQFFQMLLNVAITKPDWLNMDKIMKIESEYDCKSVFFWIVNKGRINQREKNADYLFRSKKIQREFNAIEQNGFENGIHKSISNETFEDEFIKYGQRPISNRYHYLKYTLPKAYHEIQGAGLKLDASLGFAEEIGFRNSYGLPFNPFDFKNRKPFSFVEVPLHIMDRTFFQYKKMNVKLAESEIIEFFEKNREHCVLSVLWHNNFFTNYKFKGYLDLYKKILGYIKENNFTTISQEEIIKKYSISS